MQESKTHMITRIVVLVTYSSWCFTLLNTLITYNLKHIVSTKKRLLYKFLQYTYPIYQLGHHPRPTPILPHNSIIIVNFMNQCISEIRFPKIYITWLIYFWTSNTYYVFVYACVRSCVYICVLIGTCLYIYMCVCMCVYICVYVYVCIPSW